jgi:hypothetical protein
MALAMCVLLMIWYSNNAVGVQSWLVSQFDHGRPFGHGNYPHEPTLADQCLTATAGHLLVADSRGYVCDRFSLGRTSHRNCCVPGMDRWLLQCNSCADIVANGSDRYCCELYEFCVSCCMAHHLNGTIDSDADLRRRDSLRIVPHKSDRGPTNYSLFKWCAYSCRSNSVSTPSAPNLGRRDDGPQPILYDPNDPTAHLFCVLPMPTEYSEIKAVDVHRSPSPSPSRSASVSPTPVPLDDWLEF